MKKYLPYILAISTLVSLYIIIIQKDEKDEMLKLFQSLEVNLSKSNENINEKTWRFLSDLYEGSKSRPVVSPYTKQGQKVKNVSDEFVKYLENLKRKIIGLKPLEEGILYKPLEFLDEDNLGTKTTYFDQTEAKVLTEKTDSVIGTLISLLKEGKDIRLAPSDTAKILIQPYFLNLIEQMNHSDEMIIYLKNSSRVEVMLMISKLQNNVINFRIKPGNKS